jgi:site-specific recombinase XerD
VRSSGTQSVADGVPTDVGQKVLGHISLQTTSIYVQPEKKSGLEEAAGYCARQHANHLKTPSL